MGRAIWAGGVVGVVLYSGCAKTVSPLERYQAERHYEQGIAQLYLQDTKAAEEEFKEAQELNPYEAKIYEGLGLVAVKEKDYRVALTNFKQAVELDPHLATAYQHISDVHLKRGEWEEAIKSARKALMLPAFSERHLAYYNQGVALWNLKEYEKAKAELTSALELAPQWAEARLWLGKSLFAQGKSSLAIVEYRKTLASLEANQLSSEDKQLLGYLHYQLGAAYIDKGYIEQGVEEFKRSLDIYPSTEVELELQKYAAQ